MVRSLRRVACVWVLVSLAGTLAYAQGGSTTSSLAGVIVDSAGGVIPGATIVVKNNDTGTSFETVTNSAGAFSVPALDPGAYTVTVSLAGFKTAVISDVRVLAAIPANIKAILEVGRIEETIVVRGGSELVQTQSTTVSATLATEQIKNLPLPTRNALHFVANLPGVETAAGASVRDSTINGLPESTINITIDGVNVNNNMQRNTDGFYSMIRPNLDAIEAVTVTGATPGAESAGQGAVAVRFVTRSGTNLFTGSVYHYFRHPDLNTNYWFNTRNGLDKNKVILHQYGGRVGGPIVIPGLFDGRNRAFFFFNQEELWQPTEATRTRTIFHPSAPQGVFRYNVTSGGQTVVREIDLLALARANGQLAALDPTVSALLAEIRAAAATTGTITQNTNPLTQQYVYQSAGEFVEHLPTTRIDVNLNGTHRLSGTYVWQQVDRTPDIQNTDDPQFPGFPNVGNYHSYRTTGAVTLRSTLSSNFVNELLTGWQWSPGYFSTNAVASQFENQGGYNLGMPLVTGVSTATGPNARNTINWNIDDSVNWLKGTHSFNFGGSFTRINHWDTVWNPVSTVNLGLDNNTATFDPAAAMFNTANFPGASTANINDARNLYGLLTGRITSIQGTARLNEGTHEYQYLGPRDQRVILNTIGLFAQDSWRFRPNLTFNYGVRWELQLPFQSNNDTYSTATLADLCGVSGLGEGPGGRGCNLFKPGTLTGSVPYYTAYDSGKPGYRTDWNNFAPTLGVAWRPSVQSGVLRTLLGDPEQAVLRGGYSVAYSRAGVQQFTGVYGNNPGSTINADRTVNLGNLVAAGETWPILLSQRGRLGPPPFPSSPAYPILGTTAQSLNIFDANIEVPYSRTFSAGFQRELTTNMAIELRYVGTRNLKEWGSENWNEVNVIENDFINEFTRAQANLVANVAAGRGATFAYMGPGTGTSPLPIYLAYFSGVPAAQAGDRTRYTSASFTNSTFLGRLAQYRPLPLTSAGDLQGNATFRANAVNAGLPSNFFVLNPNVSSANITGNVGRNRYDALQVELRRRLSRGLSVSANYSYSVKTQTAFDTLRRERVSVQSTGNNANSGRVPHAFKANWLYEIPIGRGRRFGTDMNPWLNAVAGNWEFDGTSRVQSGRLFTLTGVRLVGMTEQELQQAFTIRIDPATKIVYSLPQDIIDNTIKAYSTDPASLTGYGALGPPSGRYMAPAGGPACVEVFPGDCGEPRNIYVTGPMYTRFDFSLKKRFRFAGRASADLQVDVLNVFDAINFNAVFDAGSAATLNVVTSAYQDISQQFDPGGRLVQIVWRINW